MSRSILFTSAAASAALLAGALVPANSQQVAPLRCGDTITTDTVLTADLLHCPSNGLVIGADGVTLDLDGHTIAGDDALFEACGKREPCDLGVLNSGHDDVTIRNGSVRDFAVGVNVSRAVGNRVTGIASSSNAFFGLVIAAASRTVVRGGSFDQNPRPDGDGLGVFESHHLRILGNRFRGNGQLGIHMVGSHRVVIKDNLVARNHDMGILMEADRNRVIGNRCVRNGECLIVAPGDRNVIAGNRSLRDGGGIAIEKGDGNRVLRNVIVRPLRRGVVLGLLDPPIGGRRNVAIGNVVRRSGRDGFNVSPHSQDSILSRNRTVAAGQDGFDVRDSSAALKRNRAVASRQLGIAAVPGVVDRGGNTARASGDPRECTNVAC